MLPKAKEAFASHVGSAGGRKDTKGRLDERRNCGQQEIQYLAAQIVRKVFMEALPNQNKPSLTNLVDLEDLVAKQMDGPNF